MCKCIVDGYLNFCQFLISTFERKAYNFGYETYQKPRTPEQEKKYWHFRGLKKLRERASAARKRGRNDDQRQLQIEGRNTVQEILKMKEREKEEDKEDKEIDKQGKLMLVEHEMTKAAGMKQASDFYSENFWNPAEYKIGMRRIEDAKKRMVSYFRGQKVRQEARNGARSANARINGEIALRGSDEERRRVNSVNELRARGKEERANKKPCCKCSGMLCWK